jgi:hypothetical protein
MALVFTPIQKKMQKTTMMVIGRMRRNQEQEIFSSKMEHTMMDILKMACTMDLVFTPIQKKM